MAHKQNFPEDIREAILAACRSAQPPHYGAHFIHTDDGEPTASLGRLSGGLHALGVYDDFIVGPHDGRWAVRGSRGEIIGVYEIAETLRAGLSRAISKLYCKRVKRGARLTRATKPPEAPGEAPGAV